jgi:prevent-host-death family protein
LTSEWLISERTIFMASVSAFDAKTRFGELLKRVASGEEIVITRHDKPVARIVPEGGVGSPEGRRAAADLLDLQQAIRRRTKKAPLSDAEVRAAIEEGRR